MTSTQHTAIVSLISEIGEESGSIHELMHGARIYMDYVPSSSDPSKALERARMVRELMQANLERMNQLITELEKSRDLA